MSEQRLAGLKQLMAQRGVDALALMPGANLFYLTGLQMHPSERVTLALLTRGDEDYLLLPALEAPRAEARLRAPLRVVAWSDAEGSSAGWSQLKRALPLAGRAVAVEYTALRVLELSQLKAFAPGLVLANADELLGELRTVKDADEIAAMRRAAGVIQASLDDLMRLVKPGLSEREIAARWQWAMRERGADAIPEEPIVASGPNSAAPHSTATDRTLERGDLLLLDGWCQVDGYFTDITRTVAVGSISEELARIHEVVAQANASARSFVGPGVTCQAVDAAARDAVGRAGLGEYFPHRTGHGLGLEIHEPPFIVAGNGETLRPGMTFTIEPGVYVPGQGGVRIEDDVLVTVEGSQTLTEFTRELLVV